MRARTLLAVDGGNSKVDVVLAESTGKLLAAARLSDYSHDGAGSDTHLEFVSKAIDSTCSTRNPEASPGPVADVGVYCLAGVDFPADEDRIAAWLGGQAWTPESHLHNDTFAVLRAGTERTWGVAVVCGHGTNCAGVAPDGRTVRFPAIGPISGDWGGGIDIGQTALWHAVRAEDGRGQPTSLAELVPLHFGMTRPSQITEAIYFGTMSAGRVGELPALVFRAAAEGDSIARSIVDRQADEIVTMAATAIRRLGMTDLDVHVVLGGGVFRTGDDDFFVRIRMGLEEACPRVAIKTLKTPPVVGAVLLGLDLEDAGEEAHGQVRSELTNELLERS